MALSVKWPARTNPLWPVLAAALWIALAEILRNAFIVKPYWQAHYAELGLAFPDSALNGLAWVLWSLCFAVLIWAILRRFALLEGSAVAWFAGFFMMWVVTGNLGVLPLRMLLWAVPFSLVETALAALILKYWPWRKR